MKNVSINQKSLSQLSNLSFGFFSLKIRVVYERSLLFLFEGNIQMVIVEDKNSKIFHKMPKIQGEKLKTQVIIFVQDKN